MPKKAISKDVFDQAYDQVTQQIKSRQFRAADIVPFAVLAMQIVEKFPNLSGPDKKDLVIRLAQRLVDDYVPQKEEEIVRAAVDALLPAVIDQIVAASKGQLKLNLAKVRGCFGCK